MKKRIISLFLVLLTIASFIPSSAFLVSAADTVMIDNAKIDVDVPVNGLELKTTARIVGYKGKVTYWEETDDLPFKYTITWYESGSGTPLAKKTKAVMGKSYTVSVLLEIKSDYEFSSSFGSTNSYLNGVKLKPQKWDTGDKIYYEFTATYATIPAVSGDPIIQITKMELSPYEGNPAEIVVDVKNATNVRYQWIYTYGDEGGFGSWGGDLEIMDGRYYEGCHTNHYKQHSYFGDTWDEELSFCKIKCRITCDAGTFYTQEVWYTLIDRTVATDVNFTIDNPVSGAYPDRTAVVSDDSICTVTSVDWYGPENQNGQYPMVTGKLSAGRYYCRINVKPKDEYKFGDATKVKVNGETATYETISGHENVDFYGPDSYYIIKYFDVSATVSSVNLGVAVPEAGTLPKTTMDIITVNGAGYDVKDIDWSYYDEEDDDYYLMTSDMVFEAGKTYEIDVQLKPETGYSFPTNKANFSGKINGKTATVSSVYSSTNAYLRMFFTVEPKIEIGEVKLFDGYVLESGSSVPTTTAPTNPNARYAYFKNGVLYLNNFDARNDTLQFFAPELKIEASGYNTLGAIYDGSFPVGTSAGIMPGDLNVTVYSDSNLVVMGESFDSYTTLRVYGDIVKDGKGEFVVGTFGNVYSSAVTEPASITVNDGEFVVISGNYYGILGQYGDAGELTTYITVNGGTFSSTAMNMALSYCTVKKGNVLVNTNAEVKENICAPWDKTSSLENYKTIYIKPEYVLGDVTGDGIISSTDYLRIKAHFVGSFTLEGIAFEAGDVDENDLVSATDYLRVKGHFVGSYNLNG